METSMESSLTTTLSTTLIANLSLATIIENFTKQQQLIDYDNSTTKNFATKQQEQQQLLPIQITLDSNDQSEMPNILELWATISYSLWWIVVLVAILSIPILGHALTLMLRRYKKTNYFYFFIAMIILNLVMLLSILFNLISDTLLKLKGNFTCRLTAFVTNVTSCYSNWLWVMMFAQRFVHIFYPMHYAKIDKGITLFRILNDTRQLILLTGIMSVGTQLWAPFLMREIYVYSSTGIIEGSYCGPDSTLINKEHFKWIAAVESIWTYAIPFTITLITDIAVLFFSQESKRFTTVCAKDVCGGTRLLNAARQETASFKSGSTISSAQKKIVHYSNSNNDNTKHRALNQSNSLQITNGNSRTAAKTYIFGISSENFYQQWNSQQTLSPIIQLKPEAKTSSEQLTVNTSPRSTRTLSFSQYGNLSFRHNKCNHFPHHQRQQPQQQHLETSTAFKIQSEDSLRACHRRRQRAIRRCLMLATMQLVLNVPNYVLQLVDEFTTLRQTSQRFAVFYLYADAVFYLLYLSQYPMITVYVRWFHSNMGLTTRKRSKRNGFNDNTSAFKNFFDLEKLSLKTSRFFKTKPALFNKTADPKSVLIDSKEMLAATKPQQNLSTDNLTIANLNDGISVGIPSTKRYSTGCVPLLTRVVT